jgi:hypothetical protein
VTTTRAGNEQTAEPAPQALPAGPLPLAQTVLAVTARPGQESADLGLLLYAFRRHGACLALLSLTRGEASPLNSTAAHVSQSRAGPRGKFAWRSQPSRERLRWLMLRAT